ncbi:MAG TPA: amidase family protein [Mycobacteriales bacterium]|nr:amidase family protein [Mycobacteriales bacterium]
MSDDVVGCTATELAALVKARTVSPTEVVRAHLARIGAVDARYGAFQVVCGEQALAEAAALERRDSLADLPLAGVPVAIKDHVDVAGLPTRNGSLASDPEPRPADHPVVARLRRAGAIVIGKTRTPELCAWPFTDSSFGVTRSPWDPSRTAGGSSGGSGAAVAAGMVPIAHGTDGGGSIRIPAAACGLFGFKPGTGTAPSLDGRDWYGLLVNGPLATTVDDAAAMLAVMADRPDLASPPPAARTLRIALSFRTQLPVTLESRYRDATRLIADQLSDAGHDVREADPPYGADPARALVARAMGGIAHDAQGLAVRQLERRSRPNLLIGRVTNRTGLLATRAWTRYRQAIAAFFNDFDLLLTPTLAAPPAPAEGWSRRGWLRNFRHTTWAGYTPAWNVAGNPAAALPVRVDDDHIPPSVQLVGPDGSEAVILAVCRQIEQRHPWRRHPPTVGITSR